MATTKKITQLEKSAVRLEITVPRDELRAAYEKAVNDISKTVQIPGFRRGKTPRDVLERKFGSVLRDEALNTIVGETVKDIVDGETFPKDLTPLPYSQPMLEGDALSIDLEKDLEFSVKWDARPQVVLETWKGFTVEVPDVAVEDADIDRELERIRQRNATVMDRSPDEEARYGDVVTVDYAEVDEHFVTVPGTGRENFVFTLGSLASVYQFDEDIVGMKIGDLKVIEKAFPEDYEVSDLAGKTKNISIKVVALKENKLPDLDDDLAQDVHEKFETLEDLKTEIRQSLVRSLEERLDEWKYIAIMEKIIEKNPVDLPESMIQYEIEAQVTNMCRMQGLKDEQILKILTGKNQTYTAIAEREWPNAVKSLQLVLVQQKLRDDLHIEVSEDDWNAEFKAIAERQDVDLAQVEDYYKQEDRRSEADDYLKTRKLKEALFKENTVKVGVKQSYADFMRGVVQ
jgi:trigger factor